MNRIISVRTLILSMRSVEGRSHVVKLVLKSKYLCCFKHVLGIQTVTFYSLRRATDHTPEVCEESVITVNYQSSNETVQRFPERKRVRAQICGRVLWETENTSSWICIPGTWFYRRQSSCEGLKFMKTWPWFGRHGLLNIHRFGPFCF